VGASACRQDSAAAGFSSDRCSIGRIPIDGVVTPEESSSAAGWQMFQGHELVLRIRLGPNQGPGCA
jgi:hypothetical protein